MTIVTDYIYVYIWTELDHDPTMQSINRFVYKISFVLFRDLDDLMSALYYTCIGSTLCTDEK